MKKIHFIAVALMATITTWAQNIAVVSPSNVTKVRQTLDEAISEAEDGSIIYLPGGGFQIKDETIITKRLTIMGVSHRGDTDNVDGATVIAGNICFVGGSSGSSVTGVYVSGDINVGDEENYVSNLTVRFCNVNSIQVKNSNSSGMIINQCYLRNTSNFGNCNVRLENNILHSAININGGIISSKNYYKIFFFLLLKAIIINRNIKEFFKHNDFDLLYEECQNLRIPFNQYEEWIINKFKLNGDKRDKNLYDTVINDCFICSSLI